MSDQSLNRSGMSIELNGTSGEAEEKIRPVSISSPSSSSSSSSSLSWLKRPTNAYGISSESETSLEYLETPVTEEFKECTPKSRKTPTPEEANLSFVSDSSSLDTSINSGPSVSAIQRRSGYYGRRTKEERAKLRLEKIAAGAANQSANHSLPLSLGNSSPASPQVTVTAVLSYLEKVIQETVDTEKIYVKDLKDIIRGYLLPFAKAKDIQVPREDLHALFGNIKAIYKFNRRFVDRLKKSHLDPVVIGKCFVDECDGFKVYADYCTNYPRSLETLSRYSLDPRFAFLLKRLQEGLNHPLPLQTYLFKPIQRILKYHLLLKNIVSHHNESLPGHEILVQAHTSMMDVANHLNEMKRNQERRTEIQRLLLGNNGMDLSSFGDLILEDKFNNGLRDVNWAFLFRKGLLIAKKRRDDQLQLKTTIMCSNLMLVESIPREPLSFHVLPFDSPKTQYTLQARNLDQKQRWCREIKTLMLDSYNVVIPEKVRQLLMRTGNGPKEQDRHFEIPKRHVAPEYLERRRLRRQSISSISGSNDRSLVESTVARTLEKTGRSSENLLQIKNEDTRSRGSRSRPLRVDSVLHQTGERRSQSLDSLRNMEQDSEPISQVVKSEQKNRVERGEDRGSKLEQQPKLKRSDEKRKRDSGKPQEDREIRKCRSRSREAKPNGMELQKREENSFEDVEEPESGPRRLEENWYSNEYKEDLAKTLVYEDKKRNEIINTKDCEDEQRSERMSMNVCEDWKKSGRANKKGYEDKRRISKNVYEDEKKSERVNKKEYEDKERISMAIYEGEKKTERTNVKVYEEDPRSQRISMNVYEGEKKNKRTKMKGYDDKERISKAVYEDEKQNEGINIKGYEDKQIITVTVCEDENRNESESTEAESREGSGEELTVPTGEKLDKGASDGLKVAKVLRANSFLTAMDLSHVDSIVVKRSKVQVRRKRSEEQQESDEEEEEDSSESDDGHYQPKLDPISDQNSSNLGDDSVEDSEQQQSLLRFGQADPCISEKWSEICSAFGLVDEKRGACYDSRHSSVSFLSTTFESLPADELLTDITQESLVTEEFFNSNKVQEVEGGKTNKVISGGRDDVHQSVEDPSRVESSEHLDSSEQSNVIDPRVEFFKQISSTPSKADSSIEVEVAVANPCVNPDGNTASTSRENTDSLRNIFKEIEQFFPTESSHSNCSADESNNSSIPNRTISEDTRPFHAALAAFTESVNAKSPTLRPGRQQSEFTPQRDGSARDDLKGASVRYSSSLPSLNDQHTSETCNSTAHGSVMQAVAVCPSLVHSRKLSSSDMTGYFSAGKVPTAGDYPSVSGPVSSVRLDSKGPVQSRKSSSGTDAGETEEQDATGQFEKSFEVRKMSESSDTCNVQSGTSPGTATDDVDANPLPAPQPVDKYRNRRKLFFEKVSSPVVPGVGATDQLQDVRTEFQKRDETKMETSNSNESAAKSKQYKNSSGGSNYHAGLSPIRSPSGSERLFEEIPYREVARRFDRQHTYVYRLARAYSSRVKQLQNEAALYQNTVKSSIRRPLRKWSTVDESSSRHERKSSVGDVVRRDSSSALPQNRNTVCLAENDLELSTSVRSTVSASSSPFQSTRNANSVADSWRPISESRAKVRSSSRKLAKPFGLSFDGLPDFCFNGSKDESDCEDCFDEAQETSTDLIKQRVRLFEGHKESNC